MVGLYSLREGCNPSVKRYALMSHVQNQTAPASPAVEFINFGSRFSFHFFEWVTTPGSCDLAALLATARKDALETFRQDKEAGALEELTVGSLAEELRVVAVQAAEELTDGVVYSADEAPCDADGPVGLFAPAIEDALGDVDYEAVARAVMIKQKAEKGAAKDKAAAAE
jgi:hypothetical protein